MTPITIQAAVCRTQGKALAIENLQLAPPSNDEVRIKLAACSICHSDIAQINGSWAGSGNPFVMGHEAAGTIMDIGNEVTNFAIGDSVVVTLIRSCGNCSVCNAGHPTGCTELDDRLSPLSTEQGEVVEQGFRCGAFATHCVVQQSQIVKIPPSVSMASAALLGCAVLTGFGAVVNVADIPLNSKVAVIGNGGLGLNAIQAAVLRKANMIVAIDIFDEKLEAASAFGATATINSRQIDPFEALQELCAEGLDYVFVTAGNKEMFSKSLDMVNKYGTSVIVGMPADKDKEFEVDSHTLTSGRKILGCKMGDTIIERDIPMLIDLYEKEQLKLDELITSRYPLSQINEAIDEVLAGKALRNVIEY